MAAKKRTEPPEPTEPLIPFPSDGALEPNYQEIDKLVFDEIAAWRKANAAKAKARRAAKRDAKRQAATTQKPPAHSNRKPK